MSTLFTTKEVANYLKINEKKVYQLIKEGLIPCTRVAGKWLFPKEMIDDWIKKSINVRDDILIAGSNDPFLAHLISNFTKQNFPNSLIFYSSIGSAKGLIALSKNKATIAVSHLFDPNSGEYNLPFVKKYLNDIPIIIINLAYRTQGFLMRKNISNRIETVEDIAKYKVSFINRNKGSGTRLLFDYLLQKAKIDPSTIMGYNLESTTHLEVGLAILNGKADVGLGIEYVARLLNLNFVPVQSERFDLIIKKDDFALPHIQKFLSILDPINISLFADQFPGYDFKDSGKIIYQD